MYAPFKIVILSSINYDMGSAKQALFTYLPRKICRIFF